MQNTHIGFLFGETHDAEFKVFWFFEIRFHFKVLYCLRRKCPGETQSGEEYQRLPSKTLHSSRSKIQSLQKHTQPSGLKDHCTVSSARISGNLLVDLPAIVPKCLTHALLKDSTVLLNIQLKNETQNGEWEYFYTNVF